MSIVNSLPVSRKVEGESKKSAISFSGINFRSSIKTVTSLRVDKKIMEYFYNYNQAMLAVFANTEIELNFQFKSLVFRQNAHNTFKLCELFLHVCDKGAYILLPYLELISRYLFYKRGQPTVLHLRFQTVKQ